MTVWYPKTGQPQPKPKPGYKARVHSQLLAWAIGNPYHNKVDDECCPDFGCCIPSMYEKDPEKRWAYYRRHK